MLQVYFIKNDEEWRSDKLAEMLLPLPDDMRNKISAYKDWRERQSRVLGKLLLMRLLEKFNLDQTLADLKYTNFNKPYFTPTPPKGGLNTMGPLTAKAPFTEFKGNTIFNFSTAHSAEIVVCAASTDAEIGVDIEQIVPIELSDYEEQLTKNEWAYIQNSTDRQLAFYQIWTRKEALLKALGRGIDMDFDTLDVCADTVSYDGKNYWFYPLSIADGYIVHIAISVPFDSESISVEMLSKILTHTHDK